ncbi:hypothetical protein D8674_008694 [Pyrus ussuriensis x Pyrus communis]|uniref:Uncharacterized protein n=1 Tax=Pyrus ussuriensis x Pyrus communis TaxID=2448454 RepID=A0A5N5HTI0_9ROSA|nr:hypothetical protein D8674_008694 [Pyrus ussuriensis x Pyrus communis]
MSHLIKSHKAVMTAPCSIPLPPTSAATTPTEMDPKPVNLVDPVDSVGPQVSQAPASSTSSVVLLVSAKRTHRHPHTPNTTSASTIDALGSQPGKVTQVTNECITIGYDDQHRATPMAEQHSALAHDLGQVVQTYCPMRWKFGKAMPDEKVKANKINRENKTLLHHSGSRPFSYRMEARQQGAGGGARCQPTCSSPGSRRRGTLYAVGFSTASFSRPLDFQW